MISSRFPGDIFTKIQQNLQFFQNDNDLSGRVANLWYHTDLFTRWTAQLTDIYWGLLTTISINLGILWDVSYWFASYNNKRTNSARKFPGDFANFQYISRSVRHPVITTLHDSMLSFLLTHTHHRIKPALWTYQCLIVQHFHTYELTAMKCGT